MTRCNQTPAAWMRRLAWVPLPLLLLAGPGCERVRALEPVGIAPVELEPADWEGRWTDQLTDCAVAPKHDAEGRIFVIDAAAGILQTRESGGDVSTYYLRTSPTPGLLFVTLREDEAEEMTLAALVRKEGDGVLLVWLAEPGGFNTEVTEGRMAGVPGSSPLLFAQHEEALRRMVTLDESGLFKWQEPGVLFRCP